MLAFASMQKYLIITIGFDCNNECISCMLRGFRTKLKKISFEEFKNLVAEKSKDYSGIILSGAEVTLNRDLLKFVNYAKKYFKNIRIQTNGRRLSDREYCGKLIKAGVNEFYISINGPKSQIHDSITQRPGSFEETLKGLANLNGWGVRITTNTVVTEYNYSYLHEIVKIISRFSNIAEMEFWNYWPAGKEDFDNLIPPITRVIHNLSKAILVANNSRIRVILKYFPECLLRGNAKYLNNSQPDVVIDKLFWKKNSRAKWSCVFKDVCSSGKCDGFSLAYTNKYGQEDKIVKPLH